MQSLHIAEPYPSSTSLLSTKGAPLPPLLSAGWKETINTGRRELLDRMEQLGSPLHLIDPMQCVANLNAMSAAIDEFGVRSRLFYAFKANKSLEFVEAAAAAGHGIDVASVHEHELTVRHTNAGTPISLSGPVKGEFWLRTAIEDDALIGVDSFEELHLLRQLLVRQRPKRKARLTLRVNLEGPNCRFGIAPKDLRICANILTDNNILMRFEGFSFHLGGYSVDDRINGTRTLIGFIDEFANLGLRSVVLNIGGGLPVQYVTDGAYQYFIDHHIDVVSYLGAPPSSFYPYGGQPNADDWLRSYLSAKGHSESIASDLKLRDLTLLVEPGRSALDQAGATLFAIGATKEGEGHTTLFLCGTSFNACETWFQSEFLVDPIVLSQANAEPIGDREYIYYLAGHSCLGDDVISRRAFTSDRRLRVGDILLFANTAGYQMDLLESNFHHHPFPIRSLRRPVDAEVGCSSARTAA